MKSNILKSPADSWYTTVRRLTSRDAQTITFQLTENCNMACTYCYQHCKSDKKMTWEVAKTTIDGILEKDNLFMFDFIGGEPLLEIELIEKIMNYTIDRMICIKHPSLAYFRASICSNGLLYFNDKVQNFFKKFNSFISLTISIDGSKVLHDTCRLDKGGKGTYDKAMAAVKHYRENYGALDVTKMTISPDNIVSLSESLFSLINEGFTDIMCNCIFEQGWNYNHAKILYNELKKAADYLIENKLYNKVFIRFFGEEIYLPLPEEYNDNWCGGIYSDLGSFAVDYQGDKYICIRYMQSSLNNKQKPLNIGSVFSNEQTQEEKDNIQLLSGITRRSQSTDECFYCPVATGCSWCSGYNYEEFGTPNKRATYICCMHQAASLANVYFLNRLYRTLNLKNRFYMYLPKDKALKIIDEQEFNYLFELSKEEELNGFLEISN